MDTASKSMLVKLYAENPNGELFSDAYCQVHFLLAPLPNRLLLPVTAIMQSNQGTQVAIVGKDSRVALKPIQIGRDLGSKVEVTSGLSPRDKVIDSPPETIQTGNIVRVADVTR
jgi:multidrug efflux pump subunit AcrA (membrane-fusion protein)